MKKPRGHRGFTEREKGFEPDVLPVDHRASDGSEEGFFPRAIALAASTENATRAGGSRGVPPRGIFAVMEWSLR